MFRTLLAISFPAALLLAEVAPGPPPPMERPGRARIAHRLHQIRAQRIQTCLGVAETLAKAIADRWGQFDQDSHGRRQTMRGYRRNLQEVLLGPGTEDEKNAKVTPVMAQLSGVQKQQKEAKQRFEEDIQRMLTPVQQGRFVLLMEDFQHNLIEAVGEQH